MIRKIASVSGFTLVSRIFGFVRDVVLAAVLGAGPLADAFFVALRLPNHFRAIFAEGAFNAAFVPAYTRLDAQDGPGASRLFADRVFTLLLLVQLLLLALALLFTPQMLYVLAHGYAEKALQFQTAVELTRITFPYLLMMTVVTLIAGILNARDRFAAAAAAPILLNVCMIAALLASAVFPTAAHAAASGVLAAGILEVLLLVWAAARIGAAPRLARPKLDADVRTFLKALGPATLGSMGVQVAIFADTILATFLTTGAVSALYYADRLNQLPIGVIAIAVGTVLLPEMSRRLAAGDAPGAQRAQTMAFTLTLMLSLPCLVAFLAMPDLIIRALFARGAFDESAVGAAAATLAAYGFGLIPFVLIRSAVATFLARGDTKTPMVASLLSVAVNVALKIVLVGRFEQVGLALATSVGGWVNLLLLLWFARRRGLLALDPGFGRSLGILAALGLVLAASLYWGRPWVYGLTAGGRFREELTLGALVALAALVYGVPALLLIRLRGRGLQ